MTVLGRTFFICLVLISLSYSLFSQTPSKKDYSKEGFVIQHWVTKVTFENDGTSLRTAQVQAKIQSEPGVQKFGLLTIPYQASMETLDFDYVRVRKADGSVVTTPSENIQDQSSEVSRTAPLYSDQREKHVAVKGLGIGDTLEYECRWKVTNPWLQVSSGTKTTSRMVLWSSMNKSKFACLRTGRSNLRAGKMQKFLRTAITRSISGKVRTSQRSRKLMPIEAKRGNWCADGFSSRTSEFRVFRAGRKSGVGMAIFRKNG